MISIVVPTYNQPKLLASCLWALRHNTIHPRHEVIVADDNSPDPGIKKVCEQHNVVRFLNQRDKGFPPNCNYAVSQTDGEYVCLLNSDTAPTLGWLSFMLDEMEEPTVGIVGSKLLYPKEKPMFGGLVQHAGVAFNVYGQPIHIFRGYDRNAIPVNVRRVMRAVTFACVLIRRSVWDELVGLDESFVGGQYEDVDLCLRAGAMGIKTVYTPRSVVWHHEHGSCSDDVDQVSQANLLRFTEKWPLQSDEHEYVISHSQGLSVDDLAPVCHTVRSMVTSYVLGKDNQDHRDHCERLSNLPFQSLPAVEQRYAESMAKLILRAIQGVH